MEKEKLKVIIAGYGVVGKRRRHFIDLHPNLRTVGVCDVKFDKPGIMPDGIRFYSNYRQLDELEADILFVCLPNYLAPEVAIWGLKRGLHVFCEKPPGKTVSDIENIMAVEKKHPDLYLKYGFNHRYHDSVQDALRLVESGEYGDVINMRGVYGKSKVIPFSGGWRAERKMAGGGILLDQGIHLIDLMRMFCGEFIEVKSFVSNDFWKHDVEDNAFAIMRDQKGRIAMLHSSATQWQHHFSLNIFMTKGFITLKGILSSSKSYGEEELITGKMDWADNGSTREVITKYLEDHSWKREIDEFAETIKNRSKIKCGSSHDALIAMKIVYRIYWNDVRWRNTYNIEAPD